MDESGHSGDTGAADSGDGADPRERVRVNGWATPDSPWSQTGTTLGAVDDLPPWRRSSAETRSFPRSATFPSSAMPAPSSAVPSPVQPASGIPAPAPAPPPPGFVDAPQAGEIPPSGDQFGESRWPESRPRYSDLLAHLSPPGGEPARPPAPRTEPAGTTVHEPGPTAESVREPGLGAGADRGPGFGAGLNRDREPSLGPAATRPTSLRGFDVPTPNSAPPYPYEGDLDDGPSSAPPTPPQRAAVPLVRPAAPGGRRADWGPANADSARHALSTTTQGIPRVQAAEERGRAAEERVRAAAEERVRAAADEAAPARPSYDPSSFPRRLSYEPMPAPESSGYVPPAPYAAFDRGAAANDPRPADPTTRVLPQRVPAQPDVPKVPEPPAVEPTAETPALARIATHLRRGDVVPAQERQEGFDVQAILAAVREVDGVRDASLRSTPTGAHSLRLDLAEGADPAEVSRQVARLLQERMGLDAAMKGEVPAAFAEQPPVTAGGSPTAMTSGGHRSGGISPISAPPIPAGRRAADETGIRRAADETEIRRTAVETENRRAAVEQESRRAAAEQESRRAAAEQESRRAAAEQESRRAAAEQESRRAAAEQESRKAAAEQESRKAAAEQESRRAAAEQESRRAAAEAESRRAAADADSLRAAAEAEGRRLAAEADSRRAAAEAERRRVAAANESRRATQDAANHQAATDPQSRRSTTDTDGRRAATDTEGRRGATDTEARRGATDTEARRGATETESRRAAQHGESRRATEDRTERRADPQPATAIEPTEVDCGPPRPLYAGEHPGPRIVIENVHVNTYGTDASVEVRLSVGDRVASGIADGPAVDGYLLRLCAMATAGAVDQLLSDSEHPDGPVRCFVEHAAAVPFGASQVAVVVLLLSCNGWVEQLAGSAVVVSDDRHAMVRATLAAVNRRLEALLSR